MHFITFYKAWDKNWYYKIWSVCNKQIILKIFVIDRQTEMNRNRTTELSKESMQRDDRTIVIPVCNDIGMAVSIFSGIVTEKWMLNWLYNSVCRGREFFEWALLLTKLIFSVPFPQIWNIPKWKLVGIYVSRIVLFFDLFFFFWSIESGTPLYGTNNKLVVLYLLRSQCR